MKIGAFFIAGHPRGLARLADAARPSSSASPRCGSTPTAELFLRDCARRNIRLVANEPDARDRDGVQPEAARRWSADNDLPDAQRRHLRRGHRDRPVRLRDRAWTCTARRSTASSRVLTSGGSIGPERAGRARSCTSGTSPACGRTSTSSGPKATRSRTSSASCSSGRRGRPGHPRGAPPSRAGSAAAARTSMSADPSTVAISPLPVAVIRGSTVRQSADGGAPRRDRGSMRVPVVPAQTLGGWREGGQRHSAGAVMWSAAWSSSAVTSACRGYDRRERRAGSA